MPATFSISKNEMERIKALPRISLKIGGEVKFGYFDQETNRFFQTNEYGELTGKVAVVNKAPAPMRPTEAAPDDDPVAEMEMADSNEKAAADEKSSKFNKLKPVIIVVGLIAAVCIAAAIAVPMLMGNNNDTPVDPNFPVGGEPGVDTPVEYHVTRLTRDILPGQMFTLDDLEEVVLPAATYHESQMLGKEMYAWEDAEKLLGYYAGEFIPAKTFLEETEISAIPPYGLNPWGIVDSNSTLIVAPVKEELKNEPALNYGNYIDMTVKKIVKTQVAVGTDPGDPAADPSISPPSTTQETTQTKEYPVNDLTICDILNANGESIYNIYCAYTGIPATKRLDYIAEALWNDETLKDQLTPAYILVRVTNDQAKVLGDLLGADTSVTIKLKGTLNVSNNEQYMFAQDVANVKQVIASAVAVNEQRAADEEAARQQALEEAMKKEES